MGRHSLPDPEDSVDEPSGEDVADVAHPGGDTDYRYDSDEQDLSADEGDHADEDEDFAAEHTFGADTDDEYPEFPPRPAGAAGPAGSKPPTSRPSLLGGGHRDPVDLLRRCPVPPLASGGRAMRGRQRDGRGRRRPLDRRSRAAARGELQLVGRPDR